MQPTKEKQELWGRKKSSRRATNIIVRSQLGPLKAISTNLDLLQANPDPLNVMTSPTNVLFI